MSVSPLSDRALASPDLAEGRSAGWRTLYRAAGLAALVTVVLIPMQIAIFAMYPFPDTVAGWFRLLQANPLAGLVNLDLLLVVDNVLLVVIAVGVYAALRRTERSVTTIATALWLLAIGLFIASNPAVGMLSLSNRFAAATTGAERATALAAGAAVLATWQGSAFHVAYIVGQLSGIIIGAVMLRTTVFGRAVPFTLILGNVLGFGYYLPNVGLAVSAFSGVVLWIWYILIGRRFYRMGRTL